ncbi:MAG TPA: hypothetical protein VHM20_05865, partial [Gammaproteobacteria bacterium]|nr:hypothetical protein [Gammaproteobacteria bacterium]
RKTLHSTLKNTRSIFTYPSGSIFREPSDCIPPLNPRIPAERRKYLIEHAMRTEGLLEEEQRLNEKHRTLLTTASIWAKIQFPSESRKILEKCSEIEKEKENLHRLIIESRYVKPITPEQERKNAEFFKQEKQSWVEAFKFKEENIKANSNPRQP